MKRFKRIFTDWIILKRILITLGFILLFRFGSLITMPGATVTQSTFEEDSFLGIMNFLGGGGLTAFSILALGVTPYITASIIIQLLSSDVIPALSRLQRQGERGRVKIEKITRLTTIAIAILEGAAISIAMVQSGFVTMNGLLGSTEWVNYLVFTSFLVIGAMISLWIADEITMKGIGNGTSILIFVGVVARLPEKVLSTWSWMVPVEGVNQFLGIMNFLMYFLFSLVIIFGLGFFETSERRIPIQQTGRGLQLLEENQSYLPIKVNPAGIIPVVFAAAIMTLPSIIAQFFPDTAVKNWIETNLSLTAPLGLSLYAILIVLFTFFYSHINVKSNDISENFQKSSTFIIGIKPGKETEAYIYKTINVLSIFGSTVLMTVAILPYLLTMWGVPQSSAIGGTSSLILVSVSIEFYEQLNARIIASEAKYNELQKIKNLSKNIITKESDLPLFE